jgi:hypothetical protein
MAVPDKRRSSLNLSDQVESRATPIYNLHKTQPQEGDQTTVLHQQEGHMES